MIGKLQKPLMRLAGGEWLCSFTTGDDPGLIWDNLKDAPVRIEIKKASEKRSKDANAFCWAMCKDIGDAMKPPVPKEEVYRMAIREVGEYEPLPIKLEAVETFRERWSSKGVGWFADIIDNSKLPGYKLVFAYYGTSTYTADEMSRVIEWLKDNMTQMGIPIPLSKDEEKRLIEQWGKKASLSCNRENPAVISAVAG